MNEEPSTPSPVAGRPDPDRITTRADFASELRRVSLQAGLTVRNLALVVSLAASQLNSYFYGQRLPSARQLTDVLAACGITDMTEVQRWQDALSRIRRVPGLVTAAHAPYRGLASFEPEDSDWFFGREELTQQLVELATGSGANRLPLAVVGPSGSGKSSLLRAGLIPQLNAAPSAQPDGRMVVLITPGASPLEALVKGLAPLHWPGTEGPGRPGQLAQGLRENPERYVRPPQRGDVPPAIIVDQLEEIFTAGANEEERREFVAALTALSEHTLVVFGLRADFYSQALSYPGLARSLRDRLILVSPMSADRLRRAIVEPAHKAGLEVEDGLVEVLLTDVKPYGTAWPDVGGHEAGVLPLLSHALLATWERSRTGRLTVAGYETSGGIRGAMARTAEDTYANLDVEGQQVARQLFLRLVHVGDDGRTTGARLALNELQRDTSAAAVLDDFVARRLVTLDQAAAEITHEGLLDAWPRLREWIAVSYDDLRVRQRIHEAMRFWEDVGRDRSALLRGKQLALVNDWAADPDNMRSLGRQEREFLESSAAQEQIQQGSYRRRNHRLLPEALRAFANGFGLVFDLLGSVNPTTRNLPSFESTLVDDAHDICLSLGLNDKAEGTGQGGSL